MNKAMTLIEVLTVVTIMLILMAVVFINPRPSVDLDGAARQLASDLRRAQNMAMSAEEQNISPPAAPPNYEVLCGTGVFLAGDGKTYTIFGNYNPSDLSLCTGDNKKHGSAIPFVTKDSETINLKDDYGVEVTNGQSLSIYFTIPSGSAYIDNGSTTELGIELTANDGSTRTVTVTSAGKIEIQ